MKLIILSALAVASLFAGANLYAQNMLQATVPFDFYVGEAVMPSGTYEIRPIAEHVIMVQHCCEGIAAFYPTYSNGMVRDDKGKLVFHKYVASPAKYFLSEVRGLPVSGRLALPVSRLEKDAQATVRTFETLTVPESSEAQKPK
jgi:hypothetical protein